MNTNNLRDFIGKKIIGITFLNSIHAIEDYYIEVNGHFKSKYDTYPDVKPIILFDFDTKFQEHFVITGEVVFDERGSYYKMRYSLNKEVVLENKHERIFRYKTRDSLNFTIKNINLKDFKIEGCFHHLDYDKNELLSEIVEIFSEEGQVLRMIINEGIDENEPCIYLQIQDVDGKSLLDIFNLGRIIERNGF